MAGDMSARPIGKASFDKSLKASKKRARKGMGAVGIGSSGGGPTVPEGARAGHQDEPEHFKKGRLQTVIEYLQVHARGGRERGREDGERERGREREREGLQGWDMDV